MKLSKIVLSTIVALSIGTSAYAETVTCNNVPIDLEIQTFDSLTKAIEECYKDDSVGHSQFVSMHQQLGILEKRKSTLAKMQKNVCELQAMYYKENMRTATITQHNPTGQKPKTPQQEFEMTESRYKGWTIWVNEYEANKCGEYDNADWKHSYYEAQNEIMNF